MEVIGKFDNGIKFLIDKCILQSRYPKVVYRDRILEYKRKRIRYGSELFDDLDSLLVHLMIIYKANAEQIFYRIPQLLKIINKKNE